MNESRSAPPRLAIDYLRRTATRAPGKVAVREGERSITFGALWERALRLARWLGSRRDEPLPPVVIGIPKSIAAVTAVAAAQLAGAVYVPIDPDTPEERLGRMLERLGPHLFLEADETTYRLGEERLALDGEALPGEPPLS